MTRCGGSRGSWRGGARALVVAGSVVVLACGASDGAKESSADGGRPGGGEAGATGDAGGGDARPEALRINEVLPVNNADRADELGEQNDWIELYNGDDVAANLEGFYLSDDPAVPLQYKLPAGLRIPAHDVLLLWADKDTHQGPNHLSFALNGTAEAVVLSDPDGAEIDRVEWTDAVADESFARFPDGTGDVARCARPTAGALNGAACQP